ncbi:hypothetical protein CAOG_003896 [Capsaspora owczarzaki ATCC 30864]|uniref:PH domain-containing protein n=1 Tax=Capsaspora owczarzaki (strain ATCC 30864) TaxID=595528 RepID=A0A0D2WP20_CAPO3|nr:hypothetical protein CAOG_003896 [Capsaspora owczarzaki ATCC 30864]
MLSVRKIKRIGKTAFKFKFFATFKSATLKAQLGADLGDANVVWSRSNRTAATKEASWTFARDPDAARPGATIATIKWDETLELIDNKGEFDVKDYKISLEQPHGKDGKDKIVLATGTINIARMASLTALDRQETIALKPIHKKLSDVVLEVCFTCEFLKEGRATDDDMISTWSRTTSGPHDEHDDSASGEEDEKAESPGRKGSVFDNVVSFLSGDKSKEKGKDKEKDHEEKDKEHDKEEKEKEKEKSKAKDSPAKAPSSAPTSAPKIVIESSDSYSSERESSKKDKKDHSSALKEQLAEKDAEIDRCRQRISRLEDQASDMQEIIRSLNDKVATLTVALQSSQGEGQRSERQRKEMAALKDLNGWLMKLGDKGWIKLWRRRWFSCDGQGKISYYKENDDINEMGHIDIDAITNVRVQLDLMQDKNKATFVVSVPGRDYYLMAHDTANMQAWVSAIETLRALRSEIRQASSTSM